MAPEWHYVFCFFCKNIKFTTCFRRVGQELERPSVDPAETNESPPLTPTQKEETPLAGNNCQAVPVIEVAESGGTPTEAQVLNTAAEDEKKEPEAAEAENVPQKVDKLSRQELCLLNPHWFLQVSCLEERLILQAKARIGRMVKLKKKRVELNSPTWLVEEWQKGNKKAIAQQLLNVNFDKDPRI